jgi:hypothetical protein
METNGDKTGTFDGVVFRTTGKPHGQGKMIYDDGRVYEGGWRHGSWDGYRLPLTSSGSSYDEGQWKSSQKHGYGRASFPCGDSYEGEYKFDKQHGTRVYRWNDGHVYNGQF